MKQASSNRSRRSGSRKTLGSGHYVSTSLGEVLIPGELSSSGSELPTIYESHWKLDSIMLFASHARSWLNEGKPRQSRTQKSLCSLVQRFMGAVSLYYREGIDLLERQDGAMHTGWSFSGEGPLGRTTWAYERRKMIEAISEEWDYLMAIITSARLLEQNSSVFASLRGLIEEAQASLNLDAVKASLNLPADASIEFVILPRFSQQAELVSFTYAPTIFVLGVPTSMLYESWGWPMLWHTLADIYVQSEVQMGERSDGNGGVIAAASFDLSQQADEAFCAQLCNAYTPEIAQILHEGKLDADVWRNWAEDFIRDAFATLCLGEGFSTVLEQTLVAVYAAPDPDTETQEGADVGSEDLVQSPPPALRVAVARSLARQALGAQPDAKPADQIAAILLGYREYLALHSWSPEEQMALAKVLDLATGASIPPEALADLAPRARLVAAACAVYLNRLACDQARVVAFGVNPRPISDVFPPGERFGVKPRTRARLLESTFAASGVGTAEVTNCESNGANGFLATVVCKNVTCTKKNNHSNNRLLQVPNQKVAH